VSGGARFPIAGARKTARTGNGLCVHGLVAQAVELLLELKAARLQLGDTQPRPVDGAVILNRLLERLRKWENQKLKADSTQK